MNAVKGKRGGRPKMDEPSPVDVHVGSRVRLRRSLLGMSQEKLGAALGLTFQQVQKYERGTNRISASRLWDLGRILDVPISFFFDAMEISGSRTMTGETSARDGSIDREAARLMKALHGVKSQKTREAILRLVESLAETPAD